MIEENTGTTVPPDLQHRFTYTGNISVPTEVAKRLPFREDISLYGWEDMVWGQALRDAGIPLVYVPQAEALHHHRLTMEDSLRRMETLGASAVHMRSIAPEFDRLPHGLTRIAYELAALLPTMAGRHRKAFLKGIRNAAGMTDS